MFPGLVPQCTGGQGNILQPLVQPRRISLLLGVCQEQGVYVGAVNTRLLALGALLSLFYSWFLYAMSSCVIAVIIYFFFYMHFERVLTVFPLGRHLASLV